MEQRSPAIHPPTLTPAESELFSRLIELAHRAASDAGEGAWVEQKPTSIVLHVRRAPESTALVAYDALLTAATELPSVTVKRGSSVVELMVRPADKGQAVVALRERHVPSTTVFVGDDVTDEDAFAVLRGHDIGIKVGTGDTAAKYRLASPDAVATWLDHL